MPPARGAAGDFAQLIFSASPIVKFVMGLLLLFSVISWGIILYKWWTFRGHREALVDVPRRLPQEREVLRSAGGLPVARLQPAGRDVPGGLCGADGPAAAVSAGPASPGAPAPRPTLKSITAVDRALLRASSIEVNKLEKRVTFLATTASITPFIGLFGTVWGIMTAFMNIGAQGSTDLAVVSTPIAEALIATALGLFAAIPAVYFYNHFTSKVKGYASEMDDFALEFLNISERNFT